MAWTASLSCGDGKYDNTASSKGCTPKFRKDAPRRTGDTLAECSGFNNIFLIAVLSLLG